MKVDLSTQDFEMILNNSSDGISVCDQNGDFIFFNKTGEKILGLGDMKVESTQWTETYGIFNPNTMKEFPNDELPLVKALKGETIVGCEMFIRNANNKDGIYLNVNAAPLFDNNNNISGGICVFHNITDKFIQKKLLIESNTHLQEFANSVAHDIKSPLSTAISFMQILTDELKDKITDDELDFLKRSESNLNNISSLADDLLEYSKPTEHNVEEIDLNLILKEVKLDLTTRLEQVKMVLTIKHLPKLRATKVVFRKVLQNLIENSIKYLREGVEHKIHIYSELNKDNDTILIVEDNGIGFSKDDEKKIFQPLTRVHENKKISGGGLGLSICKRLLDESECRIWATSEIGKGSKFHIYIPKRLIIS